LFLSSFESLIVRGFRESLWSHLTRSVLLLALSAVGACDGPRAVPRIEPVLHGWESPYRGLSGVEVHVFNTGTFSVPAGLVYRGASLLETRELDVPAFVVRHPNDGLVVFDTGLRAGSGTTSDDSVLAGAFHTEPGQDLPTQMQSAGLLPAEVRFVVLSHLHLDHTGEIGAFSEAEILVSGSELAAARSPHWWESLSFRSGDYEKGGELKEIDYDGTERVATFDGHIDLLGDGSILLVDLAGHTAGSQGLLVAAGERPVLLTGDASYMETSWRHGARPLLAYDGDLWWQVSWKIKKFSELEPTLMVLPGHDLAAVEREVEGPVIYHAFAPADPDPR
jgi:glyoxylase-like metal-dependent hydrolase (beta-lactamase superfamily II)